jgi:hypothetical protein
MKRILNLIFILCLAVAARAQQKPVYPLTNAKQVASYPALQMANYLGLPSGPVPTFPTYVPDSLKCKGALFYKTAPGDTALYRYDCNKTEWVKIGESLKLVSPSLFNNFLLTKNTLTGEYAVVNINYNEFDKTLRFGNQIRLTYVAPPVDPGDATNKAYVDKKADTTAIIKNQDSTPQNANFSINGNGAIKGSLNVGSFSTGVFNLHQPNGSIMVNGSKSMNIMLDPTQLMFGGNVPIVMAGTKLISVHAPVDSNGVVRLKELDSVKAVADNAFKAPVLAKTITSSFDPLAMTFASTPYSSLRVQGFTDDNLPIGPAFEKTSDFADVSRFTKTSIGSSSTLVAYKNGVTLTNLGAGTSYITVPTRGAAPFVTVKAVIDSATAVGATYSRVVIGLFKTGTSLNLLGGSPINIFGTSANSAYAILNGTVNSQVNTKTPPVFINGAKYTLYATLNGAWVTTALVDPNGKITYGTPYNVSGLINTQTDAFMNSWNFGIGIQADGGTSSMHITQFKPAYLYSTSVTDYNVIKDETGAPLVQNGKMWMTATAKGFGNVGTGNNLYNQDNLTNAIYEYDVATGNMRSSGKFFLRINNHIIGGGSSNLVYNSPTNEFYLFTNNGADSVNFNMNYSNNRILFKKLANDIRQGVHVLEGFTTLSLFNDQYGNYDPEAVQHGGYWYLHTSNFLGTSIRYGISRAVNPEGPYTTMKDTSAMAEGGKVVQVNNVPRFYVSTFGTPKKFLIDKLDGTHVGEITSPIQTGIAHPNIFPVQQDGNTYYRLVASDGALNPDAGSSNFSNGKYFEFRINEFTTGYEYPIKFFPRNAPTGLVNQSVDVYGTTFLDEVYNSILIKSKLRFANTETSFLTSSTPSAIYSTAVAGGTPSYPFNGNGHFVIQARSSAGQDLVFAGNNPAQVWGYVKGSTGNLHWGYNDGVERNGKLNVNGTIIANNFRSNTFTSGAILKFDAQGTAVATTSADLVLNAPGTVTFSGDGTTTAFNVTYNSPGYTPSSVVWMPSTDAAAGVYYITNLTATGFTVNYRTAPAAGTGNGTAKYTLMR